MNKTFATCILTAVFTIVLIRVYAPGTSSAFAQTRPIGSQQGGLQRVVNPPTTTDLMNALNSLAAQVGQLKQTVNSQNQIIAQMRQTSAVEAQNVHDISGRLGVTCFMTSYTYFAGMGHGFPAPSASVACRTGYWHNEIEAEFTQPFYH